MTIDSIQEINHLINNKIPFAYSRWGDGEWYCINKSNGITCDGHEYFKDLGISLNYILTKPQNYFLALMICNEFSINCSKNYKIEWSNFDIFSRASIDDNLQEFFQILKTNHVVFIGNEHMKKLPFIDEFIKIPEKNAWIMNIYILKNIKKTLNFGKEKIYIFAAGMLSNVLIDKLWSENNENFYIDVGSALDPYVGRFTRDNHYFREPDFYKIP